MALRCSMAGARGPRRAGEASDFSRGLRLAYFAAQTNLASDVLLWTPVFVRMAWA